MTTPSDAPLAVLVSGGLDSAVLLGTAQRTHPAVYPLYVRTGLAWETAERQHFEQFLAELPDPTLRPLVTLDVPVADLYGEHWSLTGRGVPGADTPDDAVYLPGRNVLLLSKALLWCHLHAVPTLALAVLEHNPFSDATPAFFRHVHRRRQPGRRRIGAGRGPVRRRVKGGRDPCAAGTCRCGTRFPACPRSVAGTADGATSVRSGGRHLCRPAFPIPTDHGVPDV